MRRLTRKRAELYLAEYPRILYTLAQLKVQARTYDTNIAAIILFGSIARLEPRLGSDCDILLLLHDPDLFFEKSHPSLLIEVGKRISVASISQWGLAPMLGRADGTDIDEDFLTCVAQDGVLLFKQDEYVLPSKLTHLTLYPGWENDVYALLARCRRSIIDAKRQRAKTQLA